MKAENSRVSHLQDSILSGLSIPKCQWLSGLHNTSEVYCLKLWSLEVWHQDVGRVDSFWGYEGESVLSLSLDFFFFVLEFEHSALLYHLSYTLFCFSYFPVTLVIFQGLAFFSLGP
jgi:hypothetical protein